MNKDVRYTSIAKTIAAVMLVAAPSLEMRADKAGGTNLYAYLTQSEERQAGLYTFNTSAPSSLSLVKSGIDCYAGSTYAQGTFWTTFYSEDETSSQILFPIKLYSYDTATWKQTEERRGLTFTSIASDLTFDPVTQSLYGIFSDASYSGKYRTLGRMKYTTNAEYPYTLFDSDPIAEMQQNLVAITCSRDGQLYVIDKNGTFYEIDKYTGTVATSFSTGQRVVPFFQSATCDYSTGKVYWAAYDEDDWATRIIEIDPSAKKATKVADFGSEGTGSYDYISSVFIKQDLDLATPPNAATGFGVNMTSLMGGTVAFDMPQTDTGGNSLSGSLDYVVRTNGHQVASGQAAPGTKVSREFTATESGNSVISVAVRIPANGSRPAAESQPAQTTAWVGYDVPMPPTRTRAKASGNDVTITWTAPTQGVNNGYFDKDNIKYTVYRFAKGNDNDSVNVANAISDTKYTDHIEAADINTYYYKIAALNGDMRSQLASTPEVSVGTCVPLPYSNALDSSEALDDFTIVDANNDGSTWDFDSYYSMTAYTANSDNAADDWLITPPISMKRGSAYRFDFDAVNDYPTERVEAAVGKQPTAEAMTATVIAPTDVTYNPRRRTLSGTYRATEDGLAYFGIHAISDKDCNHLYVDNLKIAEIPASAPDAPANLSVTPGEKGATTAAITFSAPTTTLGGSSLQGKLNVTIYRNGESVTTLTGITPGQQCSYNDPSVPQGQCVYAVKATGQDGVEGLEATQKVFVGNDVPGRVRNLRAYEDPETEGLIHVTWDTPEGINGGYINPSDITYYISVGTSTDDISLGNKTSYDDQLVITGGKQSYNGYSVYAMSSTGGERSNWTTCMAIGGPSLKTPMIESFKGVTMKSGPWITTPTKGDVGEAYCYCMTENTTTKAQDGDGGMQSFSAEAIGKAVRSESPKVDISGTANPMLNFWAYSNGLGDKLTVSVQKDYGEFVPALTITTDKYEKGWHRFSVDLTPYKDSKYIRVGFEGEAVKSTDEFMAYDNVSIIDNIDHDLMVTDFAADDKVDAGEIANIHISLRNNSANDVAPTDYAVVLYKDGKEIERVKGPKVPADQEITLDMSTRLTPVDNDQVMFSAYIDYPDDQLTSNNATASATVNVRKTNYPAPANLTAVSRQDNVELGWDKPNLDNVGLKVTTDDFESYKTFAISDYGDWTTYDCDKQNTILITLDESFGPLRYENAGEPMAFQVFNAGEAGIPFASWDAHSGNQMLASFSCASSDGGLTKKQNDDWLVSPELNGQAQTISFYAKAGLAGAVPEEMEVLYSTSDKAIGSFAKIGATIQVTNAKTWDEYQVQLPEGAKYFAIRCVSNNKFALLIDDISYIAKGATAEDVQLLGYNIYRDGKKINSRPVNRRWYSDEDVEQNANYEYRVTAAYFEGESRPSNAAQITFESGIGTIASCGDKATVTANGGIISVSGADGMTVRVFAADGSLAGQQTANGTARFNVAPGIYLVKVGYSIYKTVVR